MKYLILSDLHENITGIYQTVNQIINKYQNKVEAVFYNGDSTLELSDPIFENVYAVQGNNDLDNFAKENIIEFKDDDIKVLQVHGHLIGADYGVEEMLDYAKKINANIVTFGHTHLAMTQMVDDVLFINPGSIGLPKGPEAKLSGTFVILDVSEDKFIIDFYDRKLNHLDNLSQTFNRLEK